MIPYCFTLLLIISVQFLVFAEGQYPASYPIDGCYGMRQGYFNHYQCTIECYRDVFQLDYIYGDLCKGFVELNPRYWYDVPFEKVVQSIQCITIRCRSAVPQYVCDGGIVPNNQYGQYLFSNGPFSNSHNSNQNAQSSDLQYKNQRYGPGSGNKASANSQSVSRTDGIQSLSLFWNRPRENVKKRQDIYSELTGVETDSSTDNTDNSNDENSITTVITVGESDEDVNTEEECDEDSTTPIPPPTKTPTTTETPPPTTTTTTPPAPTTTPTTTPTPTTPTPTTPTPTIPTTKPTTTPATESAEFEYDFDFYDLFAYYDYLKKGTGKETDEGSTTEFTKNRQFDDNTKGSQVTDDDDEMVTYRSVNSLTSDGYNSASDDNEFYYYYYYYYDEDLASTNTTVDNTDNPDEDSDSTKNTDNDNYSVYRTDSDQSENSKYYEIKTVKYINANNPSTGNQGDSHYLQDERSADNNNFYDSNYKSGKNKYDYHYNFHDEKSYKNIGSSGNDNPVSVNTGFLNNGQTYAPASPQQLAINEPLQKSPFNQNTASFKVSQGAFAQSQSNRQINEWNQQGDNNNPQNLYRYQNSFDPNFLRKSYNFNDQPDNPNIRTISAAPKSQSLFSPGVPSIVQNSNYGAPYEYGQSSLSKQADQVAQTDQVSPWGQKPVYVQSSQIGEVPQWSQNSNMPAAPVASQSSSWTGYRQLPAANGVPSWSGPINSQSLANSAGYAQYYQSQPLGRDKTVSLNNFNDWLRINFKDEEIDLKPGLIEIRKNDKLVDDIFL